MILALRALPPASRPRLTGALARARPLTSPAVCLALFYAVVMLTHVSGFYDATLRHPALHDLEHALYVSAGLLLWWPILDADPVPSRRLGGLGRLVYTLAAMPPMAILGAYLNRHATLVYPAYAQPARELGVSALTDQASAGAIMWVAGDLAMVVVGLWTFITALVAEERRQLARDARADAAALRDAGDDSTAFGGATADGVGRW
jgi:putative copper resistance protein D